MTEDKFYLYEDCPYCTDSGSLSTGSVGDGFWQSCGNCEERWDDTDIVWSRYGIVPKYMTVSEWKCRNETIPMRQLR